MDVSINPLLSTPPVVTVGKSVGYATQATELAGEASVIASLGASAPTTTVYTASGLLDAIGAAGTADQAAANQSLDQAILANAFSNVTASQSGIYTASGGLQGLPSEQTSENFAKALKAHPSLAGTVIADSFEQGIIASAFSVTA